MSNSIELPSVIIRPARTPLEVAITQIGVHETPKGSNSGVEVRAYLRSVGIGFPAPWCMAFVYWCHEEAHGRDNPLYRTGGVLSFWQNTKMNKITTAQALANPALIKPGAIFIMNFGGGKGHTGFVRSIERARNGQILVRTIEGNSNNTGSRNGEAVVENTRRLTGLSKIIGFVV